MSRVEAEAVVAGAEHRFRPPGFSDMRATGPVVAPTNALVEPLDIRGASVEKVVAIRAEVERAWEDGRDAIWPTALRSIALRTVGDDDQARFLDRLNEHRISAFAQAVGLPDNAWPYIGPTTPPTGAIPAAGRDIPSGWIAEPIGRWNGVESEIVYDPRRFDVDIHHTENTPFTTSVGWRMSTPGGTRALWITDRIASARVALDRFDHQVADLAPSAPEHAPQPPTPGIEL